MTMFRDVKLLISTPNVMSRPIGPSIKYHHLRYGVRAIAFVCEYIPSSGLAVLTQGPPDPPPVSPQLTDANEAVTHDGSPTQL